MNQEELNKLLDRCVEYHGHFCIGQILGVRIAVKGLELASVSNPKDLIVIAENDRCIADAIQIVTGTRLGRRSFKLIDYGKMAATFINTKTGKAFRVNVNKIPADADKEEAKRYCMTTDDAELLAWRKVKVSLKPEELPGKPQRTVNCVSCGERVFDLKDVPSPKGPICIACAKTPYYEKIE